MPSGLLKLIDLRNDYVCVIEIITSDSYDMLLMPDFSVVVKLFHLFASMFNHANRYQHIPPRPPSTTPSDTGVSMPSANRSIVIEQYFLYDFNFGDGRITYPKRLTVFRPVDPAELEIWELQRLHYYNK